MDLIFSKDFGLNTQARFSLPTYCSYWKVILMSLRFFLLPKVCAETIKYGQGIQECLSRPYHFEFFEGCLQQILLGQFLNTLHQIWGICTKYVLKVTRRHNTILSKSYKGLGLILSLQNRTKSKVDMFFASCTTFWPNFILILHQKFYGKIEGVTFKTQLCLWWRHKIFKCVDSPKTQKSKYLEKFFKKLTYCTLWATIFQKIVF